MAENEKVRMAPAVRQETRKVAIYVIVGVVLMWAGFAVGHRVDPQRIPFDYTVLLGGLGGGTVAVLNFLLMGMTVQKVASSEDEQLARSMMRASYSRRMMMQMLWVVAAIVAPCFQFVAGLLPLLFPGAGIRLAGVLGALKER
ncbi:MAG: ATP synthase subunit I [Blautia sp.]|nr:ATP synthase subunit I [Blautia sp.]